MVFHAILLSLALLFGTTAGAAQSQAHPSQCPATINGPDSALQRSYMEFKGSIESGPILRRAGRPDSCEARSEGSSLWLKYKFAKGGELEAHRDPAIELTEQRLTKARLSTKTALALLERTERWAFGKHGCGIAWKKLPTKEPGATPDCYELAYRGDDCNCQARLVYGKDHLIGLVFRSAC